ncbi:DUF5683 domain-containing protein [Acetobacteroides hydrogenigenes]|uniref:DUF5683 domain-containing protein n=1 Tax=Acetobacteroides hydrogenigenes TaxID=979970 RepID=A0A4R2F1F0_9BACT|nr:DUF5683 domain-containing protein [Acetobacteroides hydrogenigenes]TCN73165.1 hypothetical protein CLV25_101384 [Acetobacteroides hydrogenigenes]
MKKSALLLVGFATFLLPLVGVSQKKVKVEQRQKKDSLSLVKVWGLATFLPGSGQVINKQYYKIPVFYGGVAAFGYIGYKSNLLYHESYNRYRIARVDLSKDFSIDGNLNAIPERALYLNNLADIEQSYSRFKQFRNVSYMAATAVYLLSIADAVVNYNDHQEHSPQKATILSAVFPGLGQVYNKKYWKVPILYGGFAALGYAISFQSKEYQRYKLAYNQFTDRKPETVDEFEGKRSADELKSARDYYRRNRDYAILGTVALYALNIIDAHVDATLYDYEIDDNLSLRVVPTIINDNYLFAQKGSPFAPGLSMSLNF